MACKKGSKKVTTKGKGKEMPNAFPFGEMAKAKVKGNTKKKK